LNLLNSYGTTKDHYLELINEFPLRPLRNREDLVQAMRVLSRLHDQGECDAAERDYADVLGEMIDRYQSTTRKRPTLAAADLLQFLLDSRSIAASDLAAKVGIAESTISEVIAGRQSLSGDEVAKLARFFKVKPDAFIPSPLVKKAF
jgi:HTH-type transcriptional regulator / antitoxin HigA